jgi:hypothetical protein
MDNLAAYGTVLAHWPPITCRRTQSLVNCMGRKRRKGYKDTMLRKDNNGAYSLDGLAHAVQSEPTNWSSWIVSMP